MKLATEAVGYQVGSAVLIEDVSVEVEPGTMVALIGPNGSGKTTLLRLLYRALQPQRGAAWLDTELLWDLRPRTAARLLGAVPQEPPIEFELTVEELVNLGRLPHQRLLAGRTTADREAATRAMITTGVLHLADRRLDALSGGERQRAVVARALAQEPSVLLLDEPTNHLDVRYQYELLSLLRELRLTTLVALHDLNLTAAYCDGVVLLSGGRVVARGPVSEVLVPDVIGPTFGVTVDVITHPTTGRLQLLFNDQSGGMT